MAYDAWVVADNVRRNSVEAVAATGERESRARLRAALNDGLLDACNYRPWFLESAPFRHRSAHVGRVFRLWRNSANSGKILPKFRQNNLAKTSPSRDRSAELYCSAKLNRQPVVLFSEAAQ